MDPSPKARNALLAAILVLAVAALAAMGALRAQSSTSFWVDHTHEVIRHLETTLARLREAETLQQALAPAATEEIGARLARLKEEMDSGVLHLKQLTADNPLQQERLRRLDDVIDESLDVEAAPVGAAAASQAANGQLEAARRLVAAMSDEERRLLEERLHAARLASWAGAGATAVTGALSLGLLLVLQNAAVRHTGQLERANAALASQAAELEQRVQLRTADLADANATLQAYAQTIAHDLRAPVRNMQGFASALLEDEGDRLSKEGQDYARRLAASAVRLDGMIADLLAYSRLSRQRLELQPVALAALIRQVLEHLAPEIERSGAAIELPQELPDVIAHPAMLAQAVDNVVANALKFVEPGVAPRIAIAARRSGDRVLLDIADRGIGIAPEHQERIFSVFERLHGADRYPGSGIGLAIARKALERMNGSLAVRSVEGGGATFTLDLQVAEGSP